MKRFLATLSLCACAVAAYADPPVTLDAGDVWITYDNLLPNDDSPFVTPTAGGNAVIWGQVASRTAFNYAWADAQEDTDFSFVAKPGFVITGYDLSYQFSFTPAPVTIPIDPPPFVPPLGSFTDNFGTQFYVQQLAPYQGTLTNHISAAQFLPYQMFDAQASAGYACLDDEIECLHDFYSPATVSFTDVTIKADVESISAVPEPSTYALLVGGIYLLGVTRRSGGPRFRHHTGIVRRNQEP